MQATVRRRGGGVDEFLHGKSREEQPERKKSGAGDRPRGVDPARAGGARRRLEPRPDRPARRSRPLDGAAHRRRARSREAADRGVAERPRAARARRSCGWRLRSAPISSRWRGRSSRRLSHELRETVDLATVQKRSSDLHRSGDRARSGCARCRRSARRSRSTARPTARPISASSTRRRSSADRHAATNARTPNTLTRLERVAARAARGAQDRRRARSRGAHARHLRRRRGAARSARQPDRDLGAGAERSASATSRS